jgi:hypothetical protein
MAGKIWYRLTCKGVDAKVVFEIGDRKAVSD